MPVDALEPVDPHGRFTDLVGGGPVDGQVRREAVRSRRQSDRGRQDTATGDTANGLGAVGRLIVIDRRKRVVIGLGTGRCGTHSLDGLLSCQPGTTSLHQPKPCLPWQTDYGWYRGVVDLVASIDSPVVALVSWFYLNYTECLIRDFDARLVCLRRDRDETVASIDRLTPQFDHWSNQPVTASATPEFRDLFPKYDVSDKRAALGCYWDEYYAIAERLERAHPKNFGIFPTGHLNDEVGVAEMLRFAGFGDDCRPLTNINLGVYDEYVWRGARRYDQQDGMSSADPSGVTERGLGR